jgi:serine/threonine protein kinase
MFTEAKILEALDHPHIIKLYEFYKTKSKKLVLILEFADGKDLSEVIGERNMNK